MNIILIFLLEIIMITIVKQDSRIILDTQMLEQNSVPLESTMFYDPNEITQMGEKIHTNIYKSDGLLFKIKDGKIIKAYFPLSYFLENPNIL